MLSDGGRGGEPHFGFCDFVTSDVFNNIGWVKRETRQAVTVSSAWAWPVGEGGGHELNIRRCLINYIKDIVFNN